jgi:hypothetical protein
MEKRATSPLFFGAVFFGASFFGAGFGFSCCRLLFLMPTRW